MLKGVSGPRRRVLRTSLIDSLDTGGLVAFWDQLAVEGAPIVRFEGASAESVISTFCWQDPEGTERTSGTRYVYLDANGITGRSDPGRTALSRMPGTHLWHVSIEVPDRWRGAYRFIPSTQELRPRCETSSWRRGSIRPKASSVVVTTFCNGASV